MASSCAGRGWEGGKLGLVAAFRVRIGILIAVAVAILVGAFGTGSGSWAAAHPRGQEPMAAASASPGSMPGPLGSGQGARIVWSKAANHVWIVNAANIVVRHYPITDLDWKTPVGTYRILRKSRRAYASSSHGNLTLNYFLPFYRRCPKCSLIGFHEIPRTARGDLIEPISGLGTELFASQGCIRQSPADARYLYEYAKPGLLVVVIP